MKCATVALHGGSASPDTTGATAVAIYQTASYACRRAEAPADVFRGVMPEVVSAEANRCILRWSEFDATRVTDGDVVEFPYVMGGGSVTD